MFPIPTLGRLSRLSSYWPASLSQITPLPLAPSFPDRIHPPLRPLSTSSSLRGRRWDKDFQYDRVKRTHYDIDKYPVHVRKRIAAERAKDRELYNPYKVEPLREDENDQFVKSHFDSKQSAYAELNDSEYHFDDSSIQQEVTFGDVGLHFKLLNLLKDDGLYYPTAIQSAVIPNAIDGKDVIGISLTGSGKTLAYVLPIVQKRIQTLRSYQKLQKNLPLGRPAPVQFVVLCPTRDLALQIRASFLKLKIRAALAVGGQAAKNQIPEIRQTPILIATPGRLLEFMETNVVDLSGVRMFVLDEADKMLNLGFFPDVQRICEDLPKSKQTMMLSATLPREVLNLARNILVDPVELDIRGDQTTVASVEQYSIFTKGIYDKNEKLKEILELIHQNEENPRVLLFCNAKREVNSVTKNIVLNTEFSCHPLHGDLSFAARRRGLRLFKEGSVKLLIGTDVVARGIDFQNVTHVINYNLPSEPETYIHRIGRTARAGGSGVAINLRSEFGQDAVSMTKIEQAIKAKPKVVREELLHTIFKSEP